jgi:hypothetical protein
MKNWVKIFIGIVLILSSLLLPLLINCEGKIEGCIASYSGYFALDFVLFLVGAIIILVVVFSILRKR